MIKLERHTLKDLKKYIYIKIFEVLMKMFQGEVMNNDHETVVCGYNHFRTIFCDFYPHQVFDI